MGNATPRLADLVEESARRLEDAGVAFGQGTTDALQEAMWLAAHVLRRPWDETMAAMAQPVSAAQARSLAALTAKRIATRKPAAYLLNEAWLGPYRFYVDERVIVPRSFIAELILKGSEEFKGSEYLTRSERRQHGGVKYSDPLNSRLRGNDTLILDLCTGSGCLAIVAALQWPKARVDAADISEDALEVARRNVADYGLEGRVRLVKSDLFGKLQDRRYDLVISNPPYVRAASMRRLPEEFRKEPEGALASGEDGLDHTRVILREAKHHLKPGGVLVVEIGHNRKALERAHPKLPFRWPKVTAGAGYVFTLKREELP